MTNQRQALYVNNGPEGPYTFLRQWKPLYLVAYYLKAHLLFFLLELLYLKSLITLFES